MNFMHLLLLKVRSDFIAVSCFFRHRSWNTIKLTPAETSIRDNSKGLIAHEKLQSYFLCTKSNITWPPFFFEQFCLFPWRQPTSLLVFICQTDMTLFCRSFLFSSRRVSVSFTFKVSFMLRISFLVKERVKAMSNEAIFLATCNAMALHCIASCKEDFLVWHPMFATSLATKNCVASCRESRSSFYFS